MKRERSGRRDLRFSVRHRTYGKNCPAMDIDFLEYDGGRAVAIIEEKQENERFDEWNQRAFIDLADKAGIPAFVVRHDEDLTWFLVTPMNEIAIKKLRSANVQVEKEGLYLGEERFVRFLYWLRGRRPTRAELDAIGVGGD